jgi:hypothetical protein
MAFAPAAIVSNVGHQSSLIIDVISSVKCGRPFFNLIVGHFFTSVWFVYHPLHLCLMYPTPTPTNNTNNANGANAGAVVDYNKPTTTVASVAPAPYSTSSRSSYPTIPTNPNSHTFVNGNNHGASGSVSSNSNGSGNGSGGMPANVRHSFTYGQPQSQQPPVRVQYVSPSAPSPTVTPSSTPPLRHTTIMPSPAQPVYVCCVLSRESATSACSVTHPYLCWGDVM